MTKIKLSDISTLPPKGLKKKEVKLKTKLLAGKIAELQNLLYAEGKHAILLVLQGMDSSGKDGATRNVFSRCSPGGVHVKAYKKPTEEEFAHDFLWRVHKHAPMKGRIQIFNRSHYEDVLIQRVHGWIDEEKANKRIQAINAFEELLQFDNQTTIIKCYMHLSSERQKEKLQERIDDPSKNWKHNPGDWEERKLWDKYIWAYEEAINKSTMPWHIIPVDQRWYRDYCIAKLVVEKLEGLQMKLPELSDE